MQANDRLSPPVQALQVELQVQGPELQVELQAKGPELQGLQALQVFRAYSREDGRA